MYPPAWCWTETKIEYSNIQRFIEIARKNFLAVPLKNSLWNHPNRFVSADISDFHTKRLVV